MQVRIPAALLAMSLGGACDLPSSNEELKSQLDFQLFAYGDADLMTAMVFLNRGGRNQDFCVRLDEAKLTVFVDAQAVPLEFVPKDDRDDHVDCDTAVGLIAFPTTNLVVGASTVTLDNGGGPVTFPTPRLAPQGFAILNDLANLKAGDTLQVRYLGGSLTELRASVSFYDSDREDAVYFGGFGGADVAIDRDTFSVAIPVDAAGRGAPVNIRVGVAAENVPTTECPFRICEVSHSEFTAVDAPIAPAD